MVVRTREDAGPASFHHRNDTVGRAKIDTVINGQTRCHVFLRLLGDFADLRRWVAFLGFGTEGGDAADASVSSCVIAGTRMVA